MAQGRAAIVESPNGDIIISQGADNNFGFVWSRDDVPVPLLTDECILEAQRRKRPGSEVWLTLTSAGADITEGSCIVMNDSGEIVIHIDHTDTEDPAWNSASRKTGVWDLEAFNSDTDEKVRLVMGVVTVSHDVTRDES